MIVTLLHIVSFYMADKECMQCTQSLVTYKATILIFVFLLMRPCWFTLYMYKIHYSMLVGIVAFWNNKLRKTTQADLPNLDKNSTPPHTDTIKIAINTVNVFNKSIFFQKFIVAWFPQKIKQYKRSVLQYSYRTVVALVSRYLIAFYCHTQIVLI